MRNPFETMRLRSILGGPSAPPSPTFRAPFSRPQRETVTPRRPMNDAELYFDEMDRIQNEVGPGVQRYREALMTAPTREQHKPGAFTRIAAGLAGFGAGMRDPGAGIEAARSINEHGYRGAMEDYGTRLGTLKEAAGIEQDEMNAKLRALQQARALGLKFDEFELRRMEAQNKMNVDQQNADSSRMRAQAYADAQRRPGYNAVPQEDGSVLYVNQRNPADRVVVPAKTVAAAQLGVARRNAATAERNAATSVRRTNIYDRATSDASHRGWVGLHAENRRNERLGRPSPDEQQDAEDFALRQMATDPVFADFIKIDSDGIPTVVEDDGSEDYQDFLEALDAKRTEILSGSSNRRRPRR